MISIYRNCIVNNFNMVSFYLINETYICFCWIEKWDKSSPSYCEWLSVVILLVKVVSGVGEGHLSSSQIFILLLSLKVTHEWPAHSWHKLITHKQIQLTSWKLSKVINNVNKIKLKHRLICLEIYMKMINFL